MKKHTLVKKVLLIGVTIIGLSAHATGNWGANNLPTRQRNWLGNNSDTISNEMTKPLESSHSSGQPYSTSSYNPAAYDNYNNMPPSDYRSNSLYNSGRNRNSINYQSNADTDNYSDQTLDNPQK